MKFQELVNMIYGKPDAELQVMMREVLDHDNTGVLPEGRIRALVDTETDEDLHPKNVKIRLVREAVVRSAAMRWLSSMDVTPPEA